MTGGESGSKAPAGKEISEKDAKTGNEEQRQKDAEAPGTGQEEKQKPGQAKDNKDADAVREAKEAGGISGSAKVSRKPRRQRPGGDWQQERRNNHSVIRRP